MGALHAEGEPRRDRAFTIFHVGVKVGAFLAPLICGTLGQTLQRWADEATHGPTVFGFTIPSTRYPGFNPLAIGCLVPLLNGLGAWQARRGREPGSLNRMALGCMIMGLGLGCTVMMAAAEQQQPGIKRSVVWLVASTVVFTIREIDLSPIGLSFVTQVAPARLAPMMMGLWYLASFCGNDAGGYLGSCYGTMPRTHCFGLMCAIGLGVGLLMFSSSKPLARATGTR